MSHIKGKDTTPELLVRKALFADGFRFRVNVSSLPGTPDIVLRRYNTVIFINGCFWHGHPGCRLYTVPKSNTAFWQEKVARNRRRDAAVTVRLEARGWSTFRRKRKVRIAIGRDEVIAFAYSAAALAAAVIIKGAEAI